jgi:hypothetical protein
MASEIRRAHRSRLLALALAACALATTTTALAEPSAAERETARGLMTQGRSQRDAKDYRAALQSFQAADAIMHVTTTGYEVAKTQELLGMLVEARDTLVRTLRIAEQPSDPAPFKEARMKAQALSDELEARVPSVRIKITGAAEGTTPSVTIDGAAVAAAALAVPFKLNPGHHVIEAKTKTASGKTEVDVAERETKDVVIALTATEGATAPVEPPTEPPPPEKPPEPPPSGGHTLTYASFGVAAVGVVLGGITGYISISKKNDATQNGCVNNKCPPSTYDTIDSANTMATISTVSFIVAGAGAAVGVLSLVLRSEPAPSAPATGIRATPWIGLGSAGVRGTF